LRSARRSSCLVHGLSGEVDRYGSPGASLVILVHGAVANRKSWLPVARELSSGFEVWCPDLPGHGSRRSESFTLAGALDAVASLVAQARPRRAIVAGDSLGGYVALALAALDPEGVAGVVAGGCSWTMTGAYGALARMSDVPVALLARALGRERMLRASESLVRVVAEPDVALEIVGAGLRVESRSESLRELAGLDLVSVVRKIRVPVAFVNGRYDWPTRAGERTLLRAARDASLAVSPRCGHGVGLLDARFFARTIESLSART
jgi:pimeloyl-ACP methyl ester carboxylesterase